MNDNLKLEYQKITFENNVSDETHFSNLRIIDWSLCLNVAT